MSTQRIFLGTGHHCLHGVVDQLATRWAPSGGDPAVWDLSEMIVALPGSLGVRRLERLLLARATLNGWRLVPPELMTLGRLPERVIVPPCRRADQWAVALACRSVLAEMEPKTVSLIAGGKGTEERRYEPSHLLSLSLRLGALFGELASSLLTARDVATHEIVELSPESQRWNAIAQLHNSVDDRLGAHGYRDVHAIGMDGAQGHLQIFTEGLSDIVLVSADYTAAIAGLLDQLAEGGVNITAMVHHDDENLFDDKGRIDTEAWLSRAPDLGDAVVFFENGPADQAARVIDVIRGFDETLAADEITIGVPDDDVAIALERVMSTVGLPTRRQGGDPMSRGAVLTLLQGMGELFDRKRYSDLAAIIRHVDIHAWLRRCSQSSIDIITATDKWHRDHLPATVSWAFGSDQKELAAALWPLQPHLEAMAMPPGSIVLAATPILHLLKDVYATPVPTGDGDFKEDAVEMIEAITSLIVSLASLPEVITGSMTPSELIDLIVEFLGDQQLRQTPWHNEIELLGWLECHLDDAPALIVTGCNHNSLPGQSARDGFLPESVRSAMGMMTLQRRTARDAFLMEATCHSGRDVMLIAGRRTASGDPLVPSALILGSGGDRVRTVDRFAGDDATDLPTPLESYRLASTGTQRFTLRPMPATTGEVQTVSVTSFSTYLKDPYLFMLKNVPLLRLKEMHDDEIELDGGQFGTFAHTVLEAFGKEERDAVASGEPGFHTVAEIRGALHHSLDQQIAISFDDTVEPSVIAQLELLRIRLDLFAQHQARWKGEGWEILHVEADFSPSSRAMWPPVELVLEDGRLVRLTGKVDRIDRHRETGQYAALDYKTASDGKNPAVSFKSKSNVWNDLQLPLYRYMLESVGIGIGPDRLGYINLPRSKMIGFQFAQKWTDQDISLGVTEARRIAGLILDGAFEPSGKSEWGRRDPFHRVMGELVRAPIAGDLP